MAEAQQMMGKMFKVALRSEEEEKVKQPACETGNHVHAQTRLRNESGFSRQ
jgi:hypothetical protein